MKNRIISVAVVAASFAPMLALADSRIEQRVGSVVQTVGNIINFLIPVAFALAVLYFFYGLAKFILDSGNEEAKVQGKNIMINGIMALFIMVTLYGIINLLGDFFGIQTNTNSEAPTITLPKVK